MSLSYSAHQIHTHKLCIVYAPAMFHH